jgi:N-acetylneuraminate synthase
LSDIQFLELKEFASKLGFLTICTPFDESSVKKVVSHGYDFIKIASASFTDWPLLEEITRHKLPVIASTAGANSIELRRGVSFLTKRMPDLTLMHCVAKYPTSDNNLNLDRIDTLRNSFKNLKIGYSAHESPNNFEAVGIAYAKGARVFEKHIGVDTDTYKNNQYSCSPLQISNWLNALKRSISFCEVNQFINDDSEVNTLNSLRRGVYASSDIQSGQNLNEDNVYFAIPTNEKQLLANDWSKLVEWTAVTDIRKDKPIFIDNLVKNSNLEEIEEIALNSKNLCEQAGVVLPNLVNFEISHHYGLDNFTKYGMVMTTIINRDYCKKILILNAGQTNPEHFHKTKEESFYCIYGTVELTIENEKLILKPGDLALIPVGKKHTIYSTSGAVIEEISSTSLPLDSYYTDPAISSNLSRKSNLAVWS